jgi:hypothetical protein
MKHKKIKNNALSNCDDDVVIMTPLLDKKSLIKKLGISEFIIRVALDLLIPVSKSGLALIQSVCLNPRIHALNRYEIDTHRVEYNEKKRVPIKKEEGDEEEEEDDDEEDDDEGEEEKKQKTKKKMKMTIATDDDLRKHIVEKRDKALAAKKVLLGGTSDQYEKLGALDKDAAMVSEFVGFAITNHHYCVYAYYIGPSHKGINNAELHNPSNWMSVPKKHLVHFHRRIRNDVKSYYTQTRYDQWSFPGQKNENPSYDPRFIAQKWLSSQEGKALRDLLKEHASLFVTKDACDKQAPPSLHYYDTIKGEPFAPRIVPTVTMMKKTTAFNVEEDRLRQESIGYRLNDASLCHVDIDEFPDLSRIPLSRDITFSFEEYAMLAKHVFVENDSQKNVKALKSPDFYRWDPWTAVKATAMALNPEMVIRRTPALIGDKNIQILEADNIEPILDHFVESKESAEEVKDTTARLLFAMMATEIMTREHPTHLQTLMDEEKSPFHLLDA